MDFSEFSFDYYSQPNNTNAIVEYPDNNQWLLANPTRTWSIDPRLYHPSTMERFIQDREHPYAGAGLDGLNPTKLWLTPDLGNAYASASGFQYDSQPSCPSPTMSCLTSTRNGSSCSDIQTTPRSSPDIPPFCQELACYQGMLPHGMILQPWSDGKRNSTGSCTLQEVQGYADAQPDSLPYEEYGGSYAFHAPEEGYHQLIQTCEDVNLAGQYCRTSAVGETPRKFASPHLRSRRATSTGVASSITSPSKVIKRSSHARKPSIDPAKVIAAQRNGNETTTAKRSFPCIFDIYGCDSAFTSKNEWKRHINTQHMRLSFWRCDECDGASNRKPNDFNRKDLFIQHVRRMHPIQGVTLSRKSQTHNTKVPKNEVTEQEYNNIAKRCCRQAHLPPQDTSCLYCNETFVGPGKWDERLEHIGRHLEGAKDDPEKAASPLEWHKDEALEDWLRREGIITESGQGFTLA